jgi:hypothetical protein
MDWEEDMRDMRQHCKYFLGVPNLDLAGGGSRHTPMTKSAIALSNQDLTLLIGRIRDHIYLDVVTLPRFRSW